MLPTILVTGGAGFIGSALVRHLIADSTYQVVNVDALTYAGNLESLRSVSGSPAYTFEHQSILDPAGMKRLYEVYRPTAIVHLAAESHVDRSIDAPGHFLQTNVLGTHVLLETATEFWRGLPGSDRESFRFIHVSTDEVYGSLDEEEQAGENAPYRPNSPYAATKAASDHLARAWNRTYGLPVIVTNCTNNFGPFQFPEKLIPHVLLSALRGAAIPVYGDGKNVRDWLHVEDHVRALTTVMQKGRVGEVYNIGARCPQKNIAIVTLVCRTLDELRPREDGLSYAEQIEFVADRPGHDRRYAIDPGKIEKETGWRPVEAFEAGLRNTVQWYVGNEWWWQRVLDGSYRLERLGSVPVEQGDL